MNRLLFTGIILLFIISYLFVQIYQHTKVRADFNNMIDSQIIKTSLIQDPTYYNNFLESEKNEGWLFYQFQSEDQLIDTFLFPSEEYKGNKYYLFIVPSIALSEVGLIENIPARETIEGLSSINTRIGKETIIPLIKK